jgi:hypothetical protein
MTGQLTFDAAFEARDRALRQVNDNADEWAKSVVDNIIRSLAEAGPFTADDARDLIPAGVSPHLLAARLNAARMRGAIVKVGERPSRLVSIHGKPIAIWTAA